MDNEYKWWITFSLIAMICGSVVGYHAISCNRDKALKGMELGYSYKTGWLK